MIRPRTEEERTAVYNKGAEEDASEKETGKGTGQRDDKEITQP